MTPRLRNRSLTSKCSLIARDAFRRSRLRLLAGATVALTLVGGASLGFALNQDAPADPVGLQGVWPEFPPQSLSVDAFSPLGGNWASWSEAAAIDVAELYSLADKDLDAQREALAKVKSRVRVLERALRDPAYSMIREELTGVYSSLKLRADLFEASLNVVTGDARTAAGPARQSAISDVRNALSSVESDLRSIPNGTAWLPYIKVEEVRRSLDTPAAADVMASLPTRLDPNAAGRNEQQKQFLNRPSLRRLATAVNNYLSNMRVAEQGADTAALNERLTALVQAVDAHEDSPTSETARAIREARDALQQAAGPITKPIDDLIRKNYLNYNFRLVADSSFLSKMVATQDINCGPVVDYFMGARIYGNQTTTTNANLQFVPSNDSARFNLTVNGVSNSRTNAYTNQATVSSVGQHQFYASKPITFDGDRFTLGPAQVSVNPSIRHLGVSTKYDNIFFGLFRGMIQRKAMTEANSRLPAGRAHAAERVRENVLPEFNSEVDQQFGELNADLAGFERRMANKGVAPRSERVRTTSERFLLDAAIREGVEVSGSPPNIGSTRGVGFTAQIHESLLNNAADRWGFAGRTMTDDQVREELRQWFSDLLGRNIEFKKDENKTESTTLIFSETDPIRFRIRNGAVILILRAGIVQEDGEEIPPQIVEVPLNLSVQGDQIVIERGTIIVSPVDPPRSRATQIARAGVMRRKLEQSIKGGTRDAVIDIERSGRSPMQMRVQRVDARGGWLTIYGV
ncbi:MAG: hypothetical protein M3552_06240 [Planctomycetota bacterium]|nr:hypothetical protein [Planctomycetota bacterium]